MSRKMRLAIAGLTFDVISEEPDLTFTADGMYRQFVTAPGPEADARVSLRWGNADPPREPTPLFDTGGGLWRLHRASDGGLLFLFTSPAFGARPYQSAHFSPDFTCGQVELRKDAFASRGAIFPLQAPLDELLMVHLLARGRGVQLHGCGIVAPDGGGWIFVGQSGAGKTTLARLLREHADVRILSDERIVLRVADRGVQMYGTPWHGEGRIAQPGQAPLRRIFCLRHGPNNTLTPLGRSQAVARLFSVCFPPFYDPEALASTLAAIEGAVQVAPCAALTFVPDARLATFLFAAPQG